MDIEHTSQKPWAIYIYIYIYIYRERERENNKYTFIEPYL